LPEWWSPSQPLYAIFDGVDDSYQLSVGGERVAAFGDPATGETVWLVRTFADISAHVVPGENVIALRVVDHVGAGGLHRAVWLSNVEPGAEDMLQR
jgi:hypothetical protein